jgi:hypothetical protein
VSIPSLDITGVTVNFTPSAIAAVCAALILAPAAAADPNDDLFLQDMARDGIRVFPIPLTEEGHSICHTLDLGPSGGGYVPDLADRMAQAFQPFLTHQQVADMIVDSVAAYCPYHRDALTF